MEYNDIIKDRSFSACIRDAFELYCANFATIFKNTWLAALIYSLLVGVCSALLTGVKPEDGGSHLPLLMLAMLVLVVIFVNPLFWSKVLPMFCKGHNAKSAYWKSVRGIATSIFIIVAVTVIIGVATIAIAVPLAINPGAHAAAAVTGTTGMVNSPQSGIATAVGVSIIGMLTALLVCVLLAVPFGYSFTAYIADPKRKLSQALWYDYRKGWHYYGLLFASLAIMTLIQTGISVVLAIPTGVLTAAAQVNATGMAMGDASTLPSCFTALSFAANTLSTFVCCYSFLWTFLTLLFAFGTVESREKMKKEKFAEMAGEDKFIEQ